MTTTPTFWQADGLLIHEPTPGTNQITLVRTCFTIWDGRIPTEEMVKQRLMTSMGSPHPSARWAMVHAEQLTREAFLVVEATRLYHTSNGSVSDAIWPLPPPIKSEPPANV